MSLASLLATMASKKLLVLGDVMLDEYIFGSATRISPEAPVMVIRHERSETLPGGAANVAKNVLAFGAEVHLLGLVGDDECADLLRKALDHEAVPHHLFVERGRATTRKTRVVADHRHQVIRIDREVDGELSPDLEEEVIAWIKDRLSEFDALVVSDYSKGFLSNRICSACYQLSKQNWKPLIVNAKPKSVECYRGATVITLNRSEASEAWGKPVGLENAETAAAELRNTLRTEAIVITMGADGMIVVGPETFRIPATRVEVSDPAGAGDTVAATIALGVSAAGFDRSVFELASLAASRVVQHVGVATVSAEDLADLRSTTSS